MQNSKKLKLGLIGAGRIGKIHAGNLVGKIPGAQLEMISDLNLRAAQELASAHAISKSTENYDDILESREIEAVIICSSTDTHAEMIEKAARKGKHIFCEKPIDLNLKRIREVVKTVDASGVKFQVGFNRRFDANFKKICETVKEGRIGKPQLVRISSRDPQPPPIEYVKVSGGIFLDMMIHDFDMARFVTQSEVEEVYARGAALVDPAIGVAGDIDTATVTLTLKNGAICTIDNSRKAVYGYDQRVEVFGSKGCVMTSNTSPTQTEVWNEKGGWRESPHFFFLERYEAAYVDEMETFVNSILKNQTPPVGGLDGIHATLIAVAAKRSLETRRPVRIEEVLE